MRLTELFSPLARLSRLLTCVQYMEFTSYAALLTGAPPSVLQKSLVAQHRQTIKVREWHFLEPAPDESPTKKSLHPLPPGNPARGHVPDAIGIHEYSDRIELVIPTQRKPIVYYSSATMRKMGAADRVSDVFLTGEVSCLASFGPWHGWTYKILFPP